MENTYMKKRWRGKFLDSLIDIKEYTKIKKEFIETSGILENDINTKYNIEKKEKEYTLLSYENLNMKIIKVPNALIPYWAKENEKLYYKNGKFNREI